MHTGNSEPGTIHRFEIDELECKERYFDLSLHNMTFMDVLKMGKSIFEIPKEIVVIGIELAKIDAGIGLSEELRRKFQDIVRVVMDEISRRV